MKPILKALLPIFLFKWNANIEMFPDLEDIKEHCKDKKHESYLLRSYADMVHFLKDIDISTLDSK